MARYGVAVPGRERWGSPCFALPCALTADRGSTCSFPAMIPEIDIRRVATLMLKHYGNKAEAESARRADELGRFGDEAGVAVWRRVTGAVGG